MLLAGALILTLLVLPTVIIAAREAIRAVPDSIRQGGYALGAAVAGRLASGAAGGDSRDRDGLDHALSRAIGETAPLIMIGAVTYISFDPTILGPIHGAPDPDLQLPAAAPGGVQAARGRLDRLVLLAILLTLNAFAIYIRNRYRKTW